MNKKEQLQSLLDKLKKNVEGIGSLSEVKKRYPKAFDHLMTEIRKATSSVYKEYVMCALRPMKALTAEEYEKMQSHIYEILNRQEMKIMATKIFRTVVASYDANDVYTLGTCAYVTILDEVYKPYWLKHITYKDGKYYSDLIDMYYEDATSTWTNDNEFSFLYPPTKEDFEADIAPALALCNRELQKTVVKKIAV